VRKGAAIETVWFPEDAVGSIVAESPDGHRVEAGLVGREGFLPVQVALIDAPAAQTAMVQLPGHALSIDAERLRSLITERPSIRDALLAYVHVLSVQTAETALCNAAYRVEQRLARWLLMCHDRVHGNELPLIHEFVSIMLGVRRASVTTALHLLEEKRLISSERGCILIRDREALEKLAGASYGAPESLYESVMGPL
jgi:CRP-like cAMP-binding protein